jgi:hypothetical protein
MLKTYVVDIKEIDDAEFALEELEAQMKDIPLLKNSMGIVSINTDYISSGVYAAVQAALPFKLVGATTLVTATKNELSTYLFSIMILTSDDAEFSFALSDALPDEGSVAAITQECYKNALEGLANEAKLAFFFTTFNPKNYTDEYIRAMSEIRDDIPIFGTLTISEENNQVAFGKLLYGGEAFERRVAVVAVSGIHDARFYSSSVSQSGIMADDIGVVTKSKGNHVYEINNIPVTQFLEKVGFDPGMADKGAQSTSFFMKIKNDAGEIVSSWAGGVYAYIDGVAMFNSDIPEGTILSLFNTTKEEIMNTANTLVKNIKAERSEGFALVYTCVSRQFTMLDAYKAEYEFIRDSLAENFTVLVSGAGGEICPVSAPGEKLYNKGQGYTVIACVL